MNRKALTFIFLCIINCIVAQSWDPVSELPRGNFDARHHPVTFSIGEYGYVVTGTVNGTPSKDFLRYQASTDTWEILPDFPGEARGFSYGTARGTKAYIGFGGIDGIPYNDLWEYDSETEEWTRLADCPCEPRYHPAFIQLDDKIFVGLGNGSQNLRDWWEYDISSNTWTEKEGLPGASRHHPFYFGINNVAYVGFGHGNSIGGFLSIYKDFYKFDPNTDEWTQLSDFPGEARVAGTQFDYDGKGYILSGDGDNHSFMETGEFWEYDPETDSWSQLDPHPGSSRWAPGNFVIDNYVYFLCGLSNIRLENDMMRFELEPISTSTEEFNAEDILVFPNPVTDYINIDADISQFNYIHLVNNQNQIVRRITTNKIYVEDLPTGLYNLQFQKGESIHIEKLVIMK